jgi:hypothetical protein
MHSDCDDDAYVHFDPEMSLKSIKHKKTNTSTAEKRTKTIRESKESKPPKKKRVQVPTDADEPLRSPSPKAKPKRSRKKAEDEFDERWEFGLKEKILEDRDLHLRILRYEPINFDVFLKLATGEEIAGGRLIFKLRAFLDKQVGLVSDPSAMVCSGFSGHQFLWGRGDQDTAAALSNIFYIYNRIITLHLRIICSTC